MSELPGVETPAKLQAAYTLLENPNSRVTAANHTCSEILDGNPSKTQVLDYLAKMEESLKYSIGLERRNSTEDELEKQYTMDLRKVRLRSHPYENKVSYTFQFNGEDSKFTVEGIIDQPYDEDIPNL